jgi:hypothetical protein
VKRLTLNKIEKRLVYNSAVHHSRDMGWDLSHVSKTLHTTKKTQFLDGFKPSKNWKKPSGKGSRRFFLDGLKPSMKMRRHLKLQTVLVKPSAITDGFLQTVQKLLRTVLSKPSVNNYRRFGLGPKPSVKFQTVWAQTVCKIPDGLSPNRLQFRLYKPKKFWTVWAQTVQKFFFPHTYI